jgi:hypothetical protein
MKNDRSKEAKELKIEDIVFVKNLVNTLCRMPYTTVFENHLRKYFEPVLGKDEVDRLYLVNRMKDTTIKPNQIKYDIVLFIKKYYPENLEDIILNIVEKIDSVKFNEHLNEKSGSIVLDDDYFHELEASMVPVRSFIGIDLYIRGTINIISAPPGEGKSLFMLSESIYQALKNNHKVLVVIVGDMDEYAVIKRIRTILRNGFKNLQDKLFNLDNIKMIIEPYGKITVHDIARRLSKEHFDFVFIDYDDNLINLEENLYVEAAQPYLVMDKVKHGKVIVFAAQGKPSSWKENNTLSVGFLATSSKKEHIADSIYIIKRNKGKDFSMLYVLKDRHGINGAGKKLCKLKIQNGVFNIEYDLNDVD